MRAMRLRLAASLLVAAPALAGPPAGQPASVQADRGVADITALHRAWRLQDRLARESAAAAEGARGRHDHDILVRKANQARADADIGRRRFEEVLRAFVDPRVKELDHDSFGVRERATAELMKLGSYAGPLLAGMVDGRTPEAQARLTAVLAKLGDSSEDEEGRLRQWAVDATASTEYGNPSWSARQAVGKPDTFQNGDLETAWASKDPDGGPEWLVLTYDKAVRPVRIRIRETFNPGAVVRVEARDTRGQWHTLWQGKDPTTQCPGWMVATGPVPDWTCKVVRITLDAKAVAGWNEIDAVELTGEDPEGDPATPLNPAAGSSPTAATSPAGLWSAGTRGDEASDPPG